MNRWVMAAVIGLTVVGCAAGVEDPQPAPGPDPVQKEPPAQTFSGELEEIDDLAKLGVQTGAPATPTMDREMPPMPGQ
ncbi:MAG: hypothetical protein KF764_03275 [Labilithrix sp.]|nr:hypothetical protein [Labilithrix sp.]MBX3224772.1 hypothetical protein [Labilithrix sp.]